MKKYKVVGMPQMHLGGPWHPHPHGKLKKNKPRKQKKQRGSKTDPVGLKDGIISDGGQDVSTPTPALTEDDLTRKQKKAKLSRKQKKEFADMSYDERVAWTNEQNAMLEAEGIDARYRMPDPEGPTQTEIEKAETQDFYTPLESYGSRSVYDEINNPIWTTAEYDRGWYGEKHYDTRRSIGQSLNLIEQQYILPEHKKRTEGTGFYKSRDAQEGYDPEVEELRRRYESIEANMRTTFGDREGDPTRAINWMDRSGRLYRKQLRALEADIQNLYLKRLELYGENPAVSQIGEVGIYDYVDNTDPENKIYDDDTGEWTGEYRQNVVPRIDPETGQQVKRWGIKGQFKRHPDYKTGFEEANAQSIAEFGYVPKKYRLDFEETVAYEDPIFIKKQSELSSAAEQLFVEGAQIGYLPTQRIPIGGDIDELESFIKEEKKNIAQFKKDKEKYNKQKEKDAKYLGINPELMGTSEGYDQLRLQMRNSDDRRLIDIYKNYFQEVDPYNYKLTKEESSKLIESGWGDGSMQSVIDLAKVVAYGAATGPMWIPAVEALFANPLFHLYMDVEFARHAPQEFMDAYEIVKNNPPEDRLGAFVNLAFGTMGIGSATRLFRQGAAGVTKGFQGVKRTKDILKGTPVSTGPITNTAADLQAGNYVDEFGNVVMIAQGKGPLSIQYTRQGKKGVDILDAQGNLVKRATGEGNVVIGFGQTEKVWTSQAGEISKLKKPTVSKTITIGNSKIEIGFHMPSGLSKFTGTGADVAKAGAEGFEIAKASEVGLGQELGDATVIAFNSPVSLGVKEVEKLGKEVDVVIANGETLVLNQKAIPQYTSKIKYKASELGFENSRIEHGSPIGIKGEPDPLFRQRADVDQTVLKPKEKGFTLSESTGSSSRGTGIYFSQPANMQKNLERGMPNANPTGYALSPYGEGYIYESTIKPDAVIVTREGMSKILNDAGYTWSTSMYDIPEEAYKILREAGVDIVVGHFKKGVVNEYNVINPEAITELSQTAKTGAKKYQVTYADRGFQKLLEFNTKAEAEAFVEKMGGKLKEKDYTGFRKDGTFDRYEHPETGDVFGIKEIRGDKEEILGSRLSATSDFGVTNPPEKLTDLLNLPDKDIKSITGFDKWFWEMLMRDPGSAQRTYESKVNSFSREIAKLKEAPNAMESSEYTAVQKRAMKQAVKDGKQDALDWVNSEEFLTRVQEGRNISREEALKVQKEFAEQIKNNSVKLKTYDPNNTIGGYQSPTDKEILLYAPETDFNIEGRYLNDLRGTAFHEFIHASNASGSEATTMEGIKTFEFPQNTKDTPSFPEEKTRNYLNLLPEQQVRAVKANVFANNLGIIKPGEKWNQEKLQELRKEINKNFFGPEGYDDISQIVNRPEYIEDSKVIDLLNTAYQYALPLIGGAGAITAASDDDDVSVEMAALPLLFTRGKVPKSFTNLVKTLKTLFKGKVPFKQSELQSHILKNLPLEYKKVKGVTMNQLLKDNPKVMEKMIKEYVVERTGWVQGQYKENLTEAELPLAIAEQDEAAQFALDFNTMWMQGDLGQKEKELTKPLHEAIKARNAAELSEEDSLNWNLALLDSGRDPILLEYHSEILFGPKPKDSKEESNLIERGYNLATKLVEQYENAKANLQDPRAAKLYDELIEQLTFDIEDFSDGFIPVKHTSRIHDFNKLLATIENPELSAKVKAFNEEIIPLNEKVREEAEKIDLESILAPDVREAISNLRDAYIPRGPAREADAVTISSRGDLNTESAYGEKTSALIEGRAGDPSLEGTTAQQYTNKDLSKFTGEKSSTPYGATGQVTKRSIPQRINPISNRKTIKDYDNEIESIYEAYTSGTFGFPKTTKGYVSYTKDYYFPPESVVGTMGHEDRHIYQTLFNYLDAHIQHAFGYKIPGEQTYIGRMLKEVSISPRELTEAEIAKGEGFSTETWQSSPLEIDANLAKERVKLAYEIFKGAMEATPNANREELIRFIVDDLKLPENKKKFIENLMSDPKNNSLNLHFKDKYRGAINPELDTPEVMANKEWIRLFLESLPTLLIGISLSNEDQSDSGSSEAALAAGILGFVTRGKIKGISPFRGVTKTPLTFKAFTPNGKIMNLAKDKMGRIPTQQALAILAKEGSGSYKSQVLTEALKAKFNGKIPSKIDPETLKNLAEETIIPLDLEVIDKKTTVGVNPEFGFENIGYNDLKPQEIIGRNITSTAEEAATEEARIARQEDTNARVKKTKELEEEMNNLEDILENFDDYEMKGYLPIGARPSQYRKELEELTKKYEELMADKPPHNLENNTLVFSSEALPGLGNDKHTDGLNSLAHVHYTVRSDSPDTFTVTQFQSDFFQDAGKSLQRRLNLTDEQLGKYIKFNQDHVDAQNKMVYEGEMLPDGSFRYADGTVVSKSVVNTQGLGPSLDGLKSAEAFATHKEGIKILQKTWEARTLQETVDYAARNGQTKYRFPTGETASKIQDYGSDVTEAVKTGSKEKLHVNDEEKFQITKRYEKIYPKLVEKIYGVKPRKVSDAQGNSWWEFDIPKDIIEGTRDIIAYKEGGQVKRKLKRPNPEFEELELSEKEALAYAQKGYIVEAIN